MRPLTVSHVSRASDVEPRAHVVQWGALARRLTAEPPVRADLCPPDATPERLRALKARLPAWIPAAFAAGARRTSEGVTAVHLLVLDYDDGSPPAEERERWSAYAHAGHTSWSHDRAHPKFRIALPLARAVSPVRWGRVFEWALGVSDLRIDAATRNPDRIFFLPALRSVSAPWSSWVHRGPWLDLDPEDLPPTSAELEMSRRAKIAEGLRARPVRPEHADRHRRRLLREDPVTRRELADRLGARISDRSSGPVAYDVTCPGCGQRSVWFPIVPVRMTGARCNHGRTCGWSGPLSDLDTP
jgi:hypothetical protein